MHHLARPGTIFSAATAGNHGRAVAWSARKLDWSAKIFVPSITIPARIEAIRKEGAEVRVVDGSCMKTPSVCATARAASRAGAGPLRTLATQAIWKFPSWWSRDTKRYSSNMKSSASSRPMSYSSKQALEVCCAPRSTIFALTLTAHELSRSSPNPPMDCSNRSPPRAASLVSRRARKRRSWRVSNCIEVSLTAWPSIRRGVDLFVSIEDELAVEAMSLLKQAMIDSGESGAAGLAGLLALRRRFQGQRVLLVNTEGQWT